MYSNFTVNGLQDKRTNNVVFLWFFCLLDYREIKHWMKVNGKKWKDKCISVNQAKYSYLKKKKKFVVVKLSLK